MPETLCQSGGYSGAVLDNKETDTGYESLIRLQTQENDLIFNQSSFRTFTKKIAKDFTNTCQYYLNRDTLGQTIFKYIK